MNHPSSFRDPSGFIFLKNGQFYRQINSVYREQYEHLISSGLYQHLSDAGLIIKHEETNISFPDQKNGYKVIKPVSLNFVSYPYEWCFSQLKESALITLKIQKISIQYGMTLKDASAYNVQLYKGQNLLIDTLSFDHLVPGQPWIAYRQYCRHFLAPLLLMKYCSVHFGNLSRTHIDGIPLDLASSALPKRSFFSLSTWAHIHYHAKMEKQSRDLVTSKAEKKSVGKYGMAGLIEGLENFVRKLNLPVRHSIWKDYYKDTNYSDEVFEKKRQITSAFLDHTKPKSVWDLGGNIGVFSELASERGITTISMDLDLYAVEQSYNFAVKRKDRNLYPIVMDLANPSPSIGWSNEERASLSERGPADAIFALALVHHLAIGNNLPFDKIISFFSKICHYALIEFIPKTDSQVKRLLQSREDVFPDYNQNNFEKSIDRKFDVITVHELEPGGRLLYWLRGKKNA